jgi:ubiquinone/menaquinone biosynthesis C-methylase UbiE
MLATRTAILDVGPGDGSLTVKLTRYFQHITAVDSSTHMLDVDEEDLINYLEQHFMQSENCFKISIQ